MLQRSITKVLILLLFGNLFQVKAQENTSFDQGKKYILAKINIVGKITFNNQTVVTFTGLEKGKEISIPGEEISTAIKKLGKLGLFNDISFYVNEIKNDSIYLDLHLEELPKLNKVKFIGIKKNKTEALIKENGLTENKIVTENLLTTTKNYLENKYKKEGFYNTKVNINPVIDTAKTNKVNLVISVDKGSKVKVENIDFSGNKKIDDKTLRKAMKNTKEKFVFRIFKASKFIKDKYKKDLEDIIEAYKEKGFRDARITSDTVSYDKEKNKLSLRINVEEGEKYYFGKIKFLGNTVYSDQTLNQIIGLKEGDVYNGVLLEKRIADKTKPDGEDITNLYQNNGYLFSNINAVEVRTINNTIDFDIRVTEGPIAYFNKITVVGNDKTNDRVIYRELRTKPGEKYNKGELVRTIREIGQLGFFDPENIDPKFKNVDSNAGTVDIEYHLKEKGSSQIELQGGYAASGFIGTLGLSFNNFSTRNLGKKSAYKPLPMGDGQKVSLRLQASNFFRTYSFSFSEPWFGGEKPVQFSTSVSFSQQYLNNFITFQVDKNKSFTILTLSAGIAKRLSEPDDFFVLSQSVSYQHFNLSNYNTGLFTFGNGTSRNLSYTVGLTRNNKGVNPIFPTYGSEFSLTAKITPPYSLLNGINYGTLGNLQENKYTYDGSVYGDSYIGSNGVMVYKGDYLAQIPSTTYPYPNRVDSYKDAVADPGKVDQQKFNWLEYYKIKFKADWYTKIYEKLVLRNLSEFGFLGSYNRDRGSIPFERFFLGGDGMMMFAMDGREVVGLRGYANNSLTPINSKGETVGGIIYNKFSFELRYPITLKSSASIFGLTFLEGGAAYDSFKNYNPFLLKKSAGLGLRVFMPAFGLLGIDFGYGFDKLPGQALPSGWQTHFIIGQQF